MEELKLIIGLLREAGQGALTGAILWMCLDMAKYLVGCGAGVFIAWLVVQFCRFAIKSMSITGKLLTATGYHGDPYLCHEEDMAYHIVHIEKLFRDSQEKSNG